MLSQRYAILTGDLVNSTKTDRAIVEAAFEALSQSAQIVSAFPRETHVVIERFRGDGWQSLVSDPRYALRTALLFTAAVAAADRSVATRIAIGIGPVDVLHPDGLGASDGVAFRESGRLLETMSKRVRIDISDHDAPPSQLPFWRRTTVCLFGALAAGWTPKQARVMGLMLALPAPSQTDVAEQIGVTQQTVQEHFETAHGPMMLGFLQQLEGAQSGLSITGF